MKHSHTSFTLLLLGALGTAGFSIASAQSAVNRPAQKPVVITPPAVKDGSNWSRAPFPAQRQFDDVKAPDGQAIDDLPPNTPATNTEPPLPPPRVAILQPAAQPAVVGTEPALLPTGRPTVTVATSLDAATFAPSLRSVTVSNREQVLADLEARLSSTEQAVTSLRGTAGQMSAEGRRAFNAASDEVKDKARALRKSVQNARKATAQEWESVRTQLAADFDAYANAVARLDASTAR